jgi:hypothetical protein
MIHMNTRKPTPSTPAVLPDLHLCSGKVLVIGLLACLHLSTPAWAAEPLYTTTSNQGGSPGTSWGSSIIWKLNGTGTAVGATAGNTYEAQYNGTVKLGNGTATTLLRNPYSSGTPNIAVFPGDSFILDTNAQIRFKEIAGGTAGANGLAYISPTNSFPGTNGLPGLVLNGGCLNAGTTPSCYVILGTMQAAPGTISYLNPANSFSGDNAKRGFIIGAQLSGSGGVALVNGNSTVPQTISGTSNTFTGSWIIKAGWLVGVGDGAADGYNSLGTDTACMFIVDPQWTPPPTFDAAAVFNNGPALLDMGPATANCGGTLILTNGGQLNLHGVAVFSTVNIEGVAVSAGTHYYSELITNFPSSFATGGSGAIVVRPYNPVPPALGPAIVTQPVPAQTYPGFTAQFNVTASVNGAPPLTYQWQRGGTNLVDGGNISGSTNATLFVSSVSAADAVGYNVVVRNAGGPLTSVTVPLTIVPPSGEAYQAAALADHPFAFYEFTETGDPSTGNLIAYDLAGGFSATYGATVQNAFNSIPGPRATDGFPGFGAGNAAAGFPAGSPSLTERITVNSPWNLNTNTVTISAWINPLVGYQSANTAIVLSRGGNTVAGLNYTGTNDVNGNRTLGYTWDNEYETYSWDSGIAPPAGIWSFVALVVTPTNATLYVMNTNGLVSATHTYPHVVQSFGPAATTLIGDDPNDTTFVRIFIGSIDDVAVFSSALTRSQVSSLFYAASGLSNYPPGIVAQPVSPTLYPGQTAQFTISAGGSDPLTYQWKSGPNGGPYSNLSDGGRVSGSTTATLVISNVSNADTGKDYFVVVSNPFGSTNSTVANILVLGTGSAESITMHSDQPGGSDWDTGVYWSDGNPASVSAAAFPGSTYELLASGGLITRLRTPLNPTVAVFPGNILTLDGTGVWTNNPATNGAVSEIRFKQPTSASGVPGTVYFKKLVMNGGQLDVGNDGLLVLQGEVDILTNAPFYNDGGNDRGYRVEAQLVGGPSSSIEYHGYNQSGFMPGYVNNLNLACPSNSFYGKWNIVIGTLLATGTNALGTNDIIIGANAAFETTYDVNNTNGSLLLSGRMYLHQNDTFRSLFVNGVPLAVGTYTFAQLNTAYPNNFPNTWTPQTGATSYTNGGSGSITVLVQPAPIIVQQPVSLQVYPTQTAQFTVVAQGSLPLVYHWRKGGSILTDAGNLSGSGTTNLTITNVVAANAGSYDCVVTNSVGAVTSVVAVLTVNPTGPPLNLTLNYDQGSGPLPIQQPGGSDWNTITNWSDGQAASVSVFSNPGSTYEVITGARLRSPVSASSSAFPGVRLTVDGTGTWVNNNDSTIGEIRFKHADPGVVYFPKLVMNGGQLDNGDNGQLILQGEIDILTNTPIYVDSAAGVDRNYQIDAWLTGSGGIEWHQYGSTLAGATLNITGTSNTYSGTWHVVQGVLLGSGPNSLGPNSITVDITGALETLYDVHNNSATLTLDGQMFLHRNDSFGSVVVGGVALAPGSYTFAQLNTTYPANFPASWTLQNGSTGNTGSGSLTVTGLQPPPISLSFQFSGGNLQLSWSAGTLLEATNVLGPWTTNNASSPYTVVPNQPRRFYRVQLQ